LAYAGGIDRPERHVVPGGMCIEYRVMFKWISMLRWEQAACSVGKRSAESRSSWNCPH